ncbi:hypothetical protein WG622_12700 [Cognatishimia sp. D5M38]|uniref:Uncharacterized protein n=1 Tax=Cognatishimia coralii TaxID=3083254 RepID=A0ABU8QI71_9RHOB
MRADDFLKILENDHEYQSLMAKKNARFEESLVETRKAEKKVIRDLEKLGIFVKSVGELMNLPCSYYENGFPLIADHYFDTANARSKDSSLRALMCPCVPIDILQRLEAHLKENSNDRRVLEIHFVLEENNFKTRPSLKMRLAKDRLKAFLNRIPFVRL